MMTMTIKLNKKELEFVNNSDDPGFYSWLITDMGGKVKEDKK